MARVTYCDVCGKVQPPHGYWHVGVARENEDVAVDYCSDACYATEHQRPPQRLRQRIAVTVQVIPVPPPTLLSITAEDGTAGDT